MREISSRKGWMVTVNGKQRRQGEQAGSLTRLERFGRLERVGRGLGVGSVRTTVESGNIFAPADG